MEIKNLLTYCQFLLRQLLPSPLVLVEGCEVVPDDGDGEGDDQDPADGAAAADPLTQTGHGADVAVADLKEMKLR